MTDADELARLALDMAHTACPRCGRIYEPPVTLPDGTHLAGHVIGGALCQRPPKAAVRRPPPIRALRLMDDDERDKLAEAIRARMAKAKRP